VKIKPAAKKIIKKVKKCKEKHLIFFTQANKQTSKQERT
jgi:hypothetical protein